MYSPIYHLHNQGAADQAQNACKEIAAKFMNQYGDNETSNVENKI